MENTATLENLQVTSNVALAIKLKKIGKDQTWLSKKLRVNRSYVNQFFNHYHYSYLEEKITRIIEREENKLNVQN